MELISKKEYAAQAKKNMDHSVVSLADVRELAEYARHDKWRCKYGTCVCGLDWLTDKLGLERIPCE